MMSEAEFLAGLTGSPIDLRSVVDALRAAGQPFCLIGGLAVNHYTEPMVTLDADFAVVASHGIEDALRAVGFVVEVHPHSINAQLPGSRLRIQITVNQRYGSFPSRAVNGEVFGVPLPVASLDDLVQGKLWAATDPGRRSTKRLKDRLDLLRLCEAHPRAISLIPRHLIPEVDQLRTSL